MYLWASHDSQNKMQLCISLNNIRLIVMMETSEVGTQFFSIILVNFKLQMQKTCPLPYLNFMSECTLRAATVTALLNNWYQENMWGQTLYILYTIWATSQLISVDDLTLKKSLNQMTMRAATKCVNATPQSHWTCHRKHFSSGYIILSGGINKHEHKRWR
jgi:hypothetical protein